jgi:hypothetical protein
MTRFFSQISWQKEKETGNNRLIRNPIDGWRLFGSHSIHVNQNNSYWPHILNLQAEIVIRVVADFRPLWWFTVYGSSYGFKWGTTPAFAWWNWENHEKQDDLCSGQNLNQAAHEYSRALPPDQSAWCFHCLPCRWSVTFLQNTSQTTTWESIQSDYYLYMAQMYLATK